MGTGNKLTKIAEDVSVPLWITIPTLVNAKINPGDLETVEEELDFNTMVNLRTQCDKQIKILEKRKKELSDHLLLLMRAADQRKIRLWNGMKLEVRPGSSASKIDATRLLERGVSLTTIQESTIPGQPYEYVTITGSKEAEE